MDEIVFHCEDGGASAGGDTDLGVDVLDVMVGGLRRDEQLVPNLTI